MLSASLKRAKEIHNRLRNPVNGRFSDEREIISAPALRRRQMAELIEADEMKREGEVQARWSAIIERMATEADQAAADQAERERQDRQIGIPTLEIIVRVVCGWYNINRLDLMSSRRTASAVYPRHIAMYLCRCHTRFSLPIIGAKFGGKDHTTVLYAFHKITELIDSGDEKVTADVTRLRRVLGVG
jgi:chromosomal replication initiation ATPase DnaA